MCAWLRYRREPDIPDGDPEPIGQHLEARERVLQQRCGDLRPESPFGFIVWIKRSALPLPLGV